MDFKFSPGILILAMASGLFAVTAHAQWQWVDKDGRKVFSDRAPPADILQKNILKQPAGSTAVPVAGTAAATLPASAALSPAVKASAPVLSGKDTQLEARKKQAAQEEEAQKRAEEEKLAKTRAENCERAQKGLITIQSGIRLSVTNAKGEREFMDDSARANETKRLQAIADSDCKK